MSLPLSPPVLPMLAKSSGSLPEGSGWAYEPKWDGFRALAFVDGTEAYLQSRNGKPLTRYFPELSFPAGRYVLDGEIVAASFDTLGPAHPPRREPHRPPRGGDARDVLRLRPARRRGRDPARAALSRAPPAPGGPVGAPVELTPVVHSADEARPWLQTAEGVIAKETGCPYLPSERRAMVKIKRVRTIDAVVMGWRPGKEEDTVGSIILALYDEHGNLREVGHSSGFKAAEKRELVGQAQAVRDGRARHGGAVRWNNARDLEWVALRPELVVEVTFDHVSDGRIRHGAKVQRWREDKEPGRVPVEQLET
jgi:ATP-dependent DNA ligase